MRQVLDEECAKLGLAVEVQANGSGYVRGDLAALRQLRDRILVRTRVSVRIATMDGVEGYPRLVVHAQVLAA